MVIMILVERTRTKQIVCTLLLLLSFFLFVLFLVFYVHEYSDEFKGESVQRCPIVRFNLHQSITQIS